MQQCIENVRQYKHSERVVYSEIDSWPRDKKGKLTKKIKIQEHGNPKGIPVKQIEMPSLSFQLIGY